MPEICVVCNKFNSQMISILQHPKELGLKVDFVLGYQAQENDVLCHTCCDELIIAFNFKQKCLQSKLNRAKVRTIDRHECNTSERNYLNYSPSLLEVKLEPSFEIDENSSILTDFPDDDDDGDYYQKYFKREKSVEINSGADHGDDAQNMYQIEKSEDCSVLKDQLQDKESNIQSITK